MRITRYEHNPVLKVDPTFKYATKKLFNPGVIYDEAAKVWHMLYTGGGDYGLMLGYAKSLDGKNWRSVKEDAIPPGRTSDAYDFGTVDDPRITFLDGVYYIVHAARARPLPRPPRKLYWSPDADPEAVEYRHPNDNPTWSKNFRRCGIKRTKDFITFEELGPITDESLSTANCVLFPEKIDGKYAMLHRPSPFTPGRDQCFQNRDFKFSIRLMYSYDLKNWFGDEPIAFQEQPWENRKIGPSGLPMKTADGWLMFYHGVHNGPDEAYGDPPKYVGTYRVGAMLLDLKNPAKVLARTPDFIMEPEEEYEKHGDVDYVVFPTANIVVGSTVYVYYGAADASICLAFVELEDLLEHVKRFPVA